MFEPDPEGDAVAAERWSMARTARAAAIRTLDEFVQDLWDENLAMVEEITDLRERVGDLTTELASVRGERDSARVSLAWEHSRLGGGR